MQTYAVACAVAIGALVLILWPERKREGNVRWISSILRRSS